MSYTEEVYERVVAQNPVSYTHLAQMLIALSTAAELGFEMSAFDIMPNLYYPYILLVSALFFMFFEPGRKKVK